MQPVPYPVRHGVQVPHIQAGDGFAHPGLGQEFVGSLEAGDTCRRGLKGMIAFQRINLAAPPFPMSGPMDIILVRNVMIYFDNDVRKALIDECRRLLKPGGFLLVGHAESLNGLVTGFKGVRPSIYLKAAA